MADFKSTVYSILFLSSLYLVGCERISESGVSVPYERTGRQLSIWGFSPAVSRQLFDMLDIVTDVAMLTFMGIPILGLIALGASVIGPSMSTGTGSARTKRSDNMLDRTKRAILYARNLFDVLANLEDTFHKYEITESECQLKAVCEVHKRESNISSKFHNFGTQISDLIGMQKDLEEYEIIPFAKIIFGQYADAATYGSEENDCDMIYSRCSHDLNDLLNKSIKRTEEEKH